LAAVAKTAKKESAPKEKKGSKGPSPYNIFMKE
jgi:hypothetical protein